MLFRRVLVVVPMFVLLFAFSASGWFFSRAIRPGAPVPSSTPDAAPATPVISNAMGCHLKDGVDQTEVGNRRRVPASGARGRGLRKSGEGDGETGDTASVEENNKVRIATFVITNRDRVPFVLRVSFGNGGAMRHERYGGEASMRLSGLALLYRDGSMVTVEKPLSEDDYNGEGFIYEVMFWQEDIQDVYEMELWGSMDSRGGRYGGVYRESINLEIEKL